VFSEPSVGSSQEEVCVVITSGAIEEDLELRPAFTPVTARELLSLEAPVNLILVLHAVCSICNVIMIYFLCDKIESNPFTTLNSWTSEDFYQNLAVLFCL